MYIVTLFLLSHDLLQFLCGMKTGDLTTTEMGEPDPEAGGQKTLEFKSLIKQGLNTRAERMSLQTTKILY